MTGNGPPIFPAGSGRDGRPRPDVVLTQAAESGESLAQDLAAGGMHVLRWPLVRLSPLPLARLRPVLERLGDYDWIFLPSPSAVRLVARQMAERGVGGPAGVRAGLVGPSSVAAFRACFGDEPAVDVPDGPPHDAARLVAALDGRGHPGRALVLNRPDGRLHWLQSLRAICRSVDVVPAYEAESLEGPPPRELHDTIRMAREQGRAIAWVAGAASQIDTLARCMPAHLAPWLMTQPLLVPHPALRDHAQALGFRQIAVYHDRRGLMLRLQYAGPTDIASPASIADNKEGPLLSSDEQKDPADPGTTPGSEGTTASAASPASDASPASPSAMPAPSTAPVASSPIASSVTAAASPASSANSPSAPNPAPAAGPPRKPFASPAPRVPDPPRASPTQDPPHASPPFDPPPPPSAAHGGRSGRWWGPALLLLLIGLAIGGWWYTQQRFLEAERESARRLQEAEARATKLDDQLRGLRDAQNQLQSRSKALEAKIAESSTQQEQLATLYEEIARARGDNALVEAEQSAQTASQHLELTGNVRGAILALEAAERRLADSDQGAAVGARRLILADIERLKALPEIDLTRLVARLDEVIARVDRLPLLADASQQLAATAPAGAPSAAAPGGDGQAGSAATTPGDASATGTTMAGDATASTPGSASDGSASAATPAGAAERSDSFLERLWQRIQRGAANSLQAVREEFRSVVTIRRVDQPENLLLSPEQKRLARDNLKLLLLNARLDLINRHEALFRKDIDQVVQSMQGLFDMDSHEVRNAVATLQSLQSQPLAVDLPSLSESLAAIKAARAASEKRS